MAGLSNMFGIVPLLGLLQFLGSVFAYASIFFAGGLVRIAHFSFHLTKTLVKGFLLLVVALAAVFSSGTPDEAEKTEKPRNDGGGGDFIGDFDDAGPNGRNATSPTRDELAASVVHRRQVRFDVRTPDVMGRADDDGTAETSPEILRGFMPRQYVRQHLGAGSPGRTPFYGFRYGNVQHNRRHAEMLRTAAGHDTFDGTSGQDDSLTEVADDEDSLYFAAKGDATQVEIPSMELNID